MTLQEKNALIEEMANKIAAISCPDAVLKIMPIENGCTRRPRHYQDSNAVCRFSVFMWQVNRLVGEELVAELNARIRAAVRHFGLKYCCPFVVRIPPELRG